jgi:hypothetical protein
MRTRDRFFGQMMRTVLPLLVWAAHFFFCYVYAAEVGGGAALVVVSLAAFAAVAVLLARAARQAAQAEGKVRLLHWVALAIALLALAGILLSSVPVLMLP